MGKPSKKIENLKFWMAILLLTGACLWLRSAILPSDTKLLLSVGLLFVSVSLTVLWIISVKELLNEKKFLEAILLLATGSIATIACIWQLTT